MPKHDELWRAKRRAYYYKIREKVLADRKAKYDSNPEKYLAYNRRRKRQSLDPTPPHVGECGLCNRIEMLYYDHDHKTGEFRGWICTRCNTGLGFFGDDPERLRAASYYLLWASRDIIEYELEPVAVQMALR